ncbi:hypothetical protein EC973_003667 [Apophysomyces ossiformis]|uniref:Arrestin-like N-terminal domain-containing protein n=1 Tax=Apophysomyces ossiformis TaxID=679940 RepID=A0A8H7BJ94_9FUNG|nr:hypothetical protein EC973_003667 [Apophysomyces ossiformis]
MKRFTHDAGKHLPPVDLYVADKPVYFIGPASRENPMSGIRSKVMGTVQFHDRKIKWNRITLQFCGKAGIDVHVPASTLPNSFVSNETNDQSTRMQATIQICQVEKELIFTGEPTIEFGLHLPSELPPSIRTDHAFVEYTLVAIFSAGTFFKKYRIQRSVIVRRHYLPGPSAMIPSIEYNGVRQWFEWSAEVPKATAVESGEVVLALRWSVEKERVEVDRVELALEELENYRFRTKAGVHHLPPVITRFPSTEYHPPSFSNASDTHFIRTPIVTTRPRPIRSHHYDPFLEISHRLQLIIHFTASSNTVTEPLRLEFPIIITDYPAGEELSTLSLNDHSAGMVTSIGGDEAVVLDLDLPEYTPRYEQAIDSMNTS